MKSVNDSSRVNMEMRASFFAGITICTMLAGLLFTTTLYGHYLTGASVRAVAPAAPVGPNGLTARL